MKKTKVLITASGGDFAQSVLKALRFSAHAYEIYGCDLTQKSVAEIFVDHYDAVPKASDKTYVSKIEQLCRKHKIQAVIPCSEAEISVLSKHHPRLSGGAALICQPWNWIKTYGDKLLCFQSLAGKIKIGAFADGKKATEVSKLVRAVGFPLVVKPRNTSGSRFLSVVRSRRELSAALKKVIDPVVQEYLDEPGGEFSTCVYKGKSFETVIAFKRKLGTVGCSWYAEKTNDPEIIEYSKAISKITHSQGSVNFQMRKTSKGVRLLEINPRFSSLVHARAAAGFHDAHWAVQESLGKPAYKRPVLKNLKYQRFFSEALDLGKGYYVPSAWQGKSK